ncbi:YbaN family protein [Isoalcanivorax beigongshangi]|uniref:Inner membrane protein n=1 Tax=Isoalcanivorax beigongshangi TaxID=3238810 RepID=A0ABV4AHE9_9GAMM
MIRLCWRALSVLFVALGLIGAVLPGLPTTVFMLLALWAAGHGWPALAEWLLNHPRFGPPLQRWQQQRAVPRQAKWAALLGMTLSALLLWWAPLPWWLQCGLWSLMAVVLVWLWTRPEGRMAHEHVEND